MVVDDSRAKLKIQLLQSSSVCVSSHFSALMPCTKMTSKRGHNLKNLVVCGFSICFKFNTETNFSHFSSPEKSKVGKMIDFDFLSEWHVFFRCKRQTVSFRDLLEIPCSTCWEWKPNVTMPKLGGDNLNPLRYRWAVPILTEPECRSVDLPLRVVFSSFKLIFWMPKLGVYGKMNLLIYCN